MKTKRTDHEAC